MPTRRTRRKTAGGDQTLLGASRADAKRELARALKTEKAIQRLTRALNREMQRTNDKLQELTMVLTLRKHALEAERESARALQG